MSEGIAYPLTIDSPSVSADTSPVLSYTLPCGMPDQGRVLPYQRIEGFLFASGESTASPINSPTDHKSLPHPHQEASPHGKRAMLGDSGKRAMQQVVGSNPQSLRTRKGNRLYCDVDTVVSIKELMPYTSIMVFHHGTVQGPTSSL